MGSDLKPCPFCGGEAEQRPVRDGTKTRCKRCSADVVAFNGPDDPGGCKRSAEQWNRRAEGVAALQQAGEPVALPMQALLDERDKFIVSKGLWSEFVDALPLSSAIRQQVGGGEEGLGASVAEASGEGTLPSPSVPPRSAGQTFAHNHAYHWAGPSPDDAREQQKAADEIAAARQQASARPVPTNSQRPDGEENLALAMLGNGTGNFAADAHHLHKILGEFDWYALTGSEAERKLHERLTRLVSCDEFLVAIGATHQASGASELKEALAGRNHHRRKAGAAKIARNRALAGLAYWKAKALSGPIAHEGWVLVPRQATTAMKAATGAWGFDCAHDVWDRMVRAAPTPPAEDGPMGAQRSELTPQAPDHPLPPPPSEGEKP